MFRLPRRIEKSSHSLQTKDGVIHFILKRSSGRKNLTICIDEKANVSVSVPFRTTMNLVEEFIHERSKWVTEKLEQAQENQLYIQSKEFDHGYAFLFLGRKYPINVLEDECRRAKIHFNRQGWHIIVPKGLCQGAQINSLPCT